MDKETSSRVSTIASRLIHTTADTVIGAAQTVGKAADFADEIQTLAASALSQDETPGQEPANFTHRLQREYAHLSGKLDALNIFLARGAPGLSDDQRELLNCQYSAMNIYYSILGLRLKNLETAEPSTPVASTLELGEPVEIQHANEDRDGPVPFDR